MDTTAVLTCCEASIAAHIPHLSVHTESTGSGDTKSADDLQLSELVSGQHQQRRRGRVQPEVGPRLLAQLRALERGDRVAQRLDAQALEAAGQLGREDLAGQIVAHLTDPQPVVRFAAALTAGKMRLRSAYRPLLQAVNDADPVGNSGRSRVTAGSHCGDRHGRWNR